MRIIVTALVLAALAGSAAASAQTVGGDSSWTAWLGCWELIQDDTRPASAVAPGARTAGARSPASSQRDMRVCVAPEGSPAGVKMTTWAGGQVVLEQAIVADGRDQPLNETGCTGAQRAEWSDNQRQLFMRAELQCTGQPRRSVTGITLLADGPAWLDIQALQVDGDQLLRVRRYRRATDQSSVSPDVAARAAVDAHRLASMPIGIEDVIHASSKVASKAVEAMLVETHTTLNLDSRTLIRLQKAGVAGSVTDLMVAMSFPDRFAVERQAAGGFSSSSFSAFSPFSATYGSYDPYFPYVPYSPLSWYSPYYYSFYGYSYSPYAFSPFAYSYWADPYRGLSDRFAPSGGGASAGGGDAAGAGRAIAGRGYTRIRPRDDGGGSAQSGPVTSSSSGGSSTSSGRSGTRSSGGGTVSSDGYSRGGSDSSSGGGSSGGGSSSGGGGSSGGSSNGGSGRTAQPR